MTKRSKRLRKSIESLKKEIEEHFKKAEDDIKNEEFEIGRYHVKEIERSFINILGQKIKLLGKEKENSELIDKFRKRLEKLKENLGVE